MWFASWSVKNTHLFRQNTDVCFFVFYFCLLIITTIAIIKVNVMIVTDTRPVNSNFIINNKVSISIICITSYYVGGKPHLFFSFLCFLLYTIFFTFQANKTKKIENHISIYMIFYFYYHFIILLHFFLHLLYKILHIFYQK